MDVKDGKTFAITAMESQQARTAFADLNNSPLHSSSSPVKQQSPTRRVYGLKAKEDQIEKV